jgi:hypothetical protein
LTLAVTEDEPIQPRQLKSKSNKFLWSKLQINAAGSPVTSAVPPLTAVSLSKVCKQLYIEVGLTHLLYTSNMFDFTHMYRDEDIVTYLVAITEERLRAIGSIKLNLNLGYQQRVSVIDRCVYLEIKIVLRSF